MMTESYSPAETIAKFYASENGTDGAHLPFNFKLITDIDATSKAADFVDVINKWLDNLPAGKVTNWVVS